MVYNAKDEDSIKIALAVSDDPLGPFMNIKAPLFDYGKSYIDGIFLNDDGIPYLFLQWMSYISFAAEKLVKFTFSR